ncbi:drug/metabolite transporter (DMT)-like permease [Nakamurella sp. UYEF19]|uniref:DMT family transporter n=1 Tax=Nakamurella sp. UYEF19 TaxID=1756392 RepID=UPI00339A8086
MINRIPRASLVAAALLFGIAPTGTKFGLDGFGPVTVLVIELLAATLVLWVALLRSGYRRPRSWRRVLVLGLLEPGLAYLLFSFGLDLTTASNAALMTGLECGFVVVLAALFLRERAGRTVIVAACVAVVGLVVLEGASSFGAPGFGDVLVIAGVLSAAAYTIVARGLAPEDGSLAITAHQFAAATVVMLPLAIVRWTGGAEPFPLEVAPRFWIAAVLVGILGGAVAFLLYNSAIVHVPAGPAGVIINLAPAFGLVSAVIWLDETLTTEKVLGALLIGLSVGLFLWIDRVPDRSETPTPSSTPVDLGLRHPGLTGGHVGHQPEQRCPVDLVVVRTGEKCAEHHDLVREGAVADDAR